MQSLPTQTNDLVCVGRLRIISPDFNRRLFNQSPPSSTMPPQRITPQPGQESVWDYPRPPRLEKVDHRIRIVLNDRTIVDTTAAYRVLETSHPPMYYLPPADIQIQYLQATTRGSFCEWKGNALYYNVIVDHRRIENAAWAYPTPTSDFEPIANYFAFYARFMDACYVDDELVTPQPGEFYGGWITTNIVGPFKGTPGSWGW
jgi:uncharacterized protein (DUF427 family)